MKVLNLVEYHPNIKPSCGVEAGEHGDPAVRLLQWVNAFGEHGLAESICADSLQAALEAIANRIAISIGPQCVGGHLMDSDPTTPELDPECQVMDIYTDGQQQEHQTALQACAVDPTPPCWSLVDDANCTGAKRLKGGPRGRITSRRPPHDDLLQPLHPGCGAAGMPLAC